MNTNVWQYRYIVTCNRKGSLLKGDHSANLVYGNFSTIDKVSEPNERMIIQLQGKTFKLFKESYFNGFRLCGSGNSQFYDGVVEIEFLDIEQELHKNSRHSFFLVYYYPLFYALIDTKFATSHLSVASSGLDKIKDYYRSIDFPSNQSTTVELMNCIEINHTWFSSDCFLAIA